MVNGRHANIFNLVRKESPESNATLIVMSVIAGISNALVLGIINAGTSSGSAAEMQLTLFLGFLTALGLFIITKHFIAARSIVLAETIINKIRVRLSNKVRHAELPRIESLGRATIYNRITAETLTISNTAPIIIDACQSAIMITFCIIYIAILSLPAVFITIGLVVSGVVYYLGEKKAIRRALHESTNKELEFFDALTNILDGFKEIKMNRAKSDAVFSHLDDVSNSTRELKIATGMKFVQNLIFSQSFFYILLGVNVFILPRFSETYSAQVIQITAAILFIMGPLAGLVSSIQVFAMANVAVENIYQLESALGDIDPDPPQPAPIREFREIQFDRVQFAYHDPTGAELFRVGPIDFRLQQGETLFIVGGNGSGKSTLMKLMTGLYKPESGAIRIDGAEIEARGLPNFRELFSIIFTDYHLFDRLYGLNGIEPDRVNQILRLLQIDNKTAFVDGRFTNRDLSGGQKKRLALAAAILEDKQVYVFDEWAADQDPPFRKFFYEEILKDFKKRGKTVIAVTHDDKYFGVADRVLKMDYGRLIENGEAI